MGCSTPGFFHHLLELPQTHIHWVGDAIQPSCPLLSPSSPAFNLSQLNGIFLMSQLFTSVGQSVWGLASVLPMNIQDWFPLGLTDSMSLLPRGLSSLLQHHSSKAQILQHSAFFMVQLSHPYMTTGNSVALTRQIFVGQLMSLLFNILTRFFTAFLWRSTYLLISWLQSPFSVILETK